MKYVLLILTQLIYLSSNAQLVKFDSTFHLDGKQSFEEQSQVKDMVVQNDGKILISYGSNQLKRYLSNGDLDASFGFGGTLFLNNTDFTWEGKLLVLPDNKFMLLSQNGNNITCVQKFDANGNIDVSFGTNGMRTYSFYVSTIMITFSPKPSCWALQDDGKIIIAARSYQNSPSSVLFRILPNGDLDYTFHPDGYLDYNPHGIGTTVSCGFIANNILFPDPNTYLITGSYLEYGGTQYGAYKCSVNGVVDLTYGDAGIVYDMSTFDFTPSTSTLLNNGDLVIGGYHFNGLNDHNTCLMRIDSQGNIVSQHWWVDNPEMTHIFQMKTDINGKVLVYGKRYISTYNSHVVLYRFNDDLSVDQIFNGTGHFNYYMTGSSGSLNGWMTLTCKKMYLYDDGRVLLYGFDYQITMSGHLPFPFLTRIFTKPVITASPDIEACEGDTVTLTYNNSFSKQWFKDGISLNDTSSAIVVTQSGFYQVFATNNSGISDTSNGINIIIHPAPAQPTVQLSGNTLTSSPAYLYQWLNSSGNIISGATQQSYTPTSQGTYFVQITDTNGCESISQGQFVPLSVSSFQKSTIKIYPVPTRDHINIELTNNANTIEITDIMGKNVANINCRKGQLVYTVNTSNISAGIYFIRINTTDGTIIRKVEIQ